MRGPVYSEPEEAEGGYSILVNYFDETVPDDRTWGILRVKNDLDVYNQTTNNSYVSLGGMNSWATQFLELTYTDRSTLSSVSVIGQQNRFYSSLENGCDDLNSPNLAPSYFNINPFTANITLSGSSVWNYTNGFGAIYPASSFFSPNVVHLSSKGTLANNMNYLSGSYSAGEALEDVTRLYTFGAGSHYYYGGGTPSQPYVLPAMVVPVGEFPTPSSANPNLLTKFIKTDANEESTCQNFFRDCPTLYTSTTYDNLDLSIVYMELGVDHGYWVFSLNDIFTIPSDIDCNTGYYKSTGSNSEQISKTANKIKIYPNPTTSELNIALPEALKGSDAFSFSLADAAGKQVYYTSNSKTGSMMVNIALPKLSSGMYIGTVRINGIQHVEKIIIR
jgi:hypothetical protein